MQLKSAAKFGATPQLRSTDEMNAAVSGLGRKKKAWTTPHHHGEFQSMPRHATCVELEPPDEYTSGRHSLANLHA
jgi:hypothetical protein